MAAFMGRDRKEQTLAGFPDEIFSGRKRRTVGADERQQKEFNEYLERYLSGLEVEKKATEVL